jgi:hypothetical protein
LVEGFNRWVTPARAVFDAKLARDHGTNGQARACACRGKA